MKVTREVISDLLPLVEAGEASADSRALVEAYLSEHPADAAAVKSGANELPDAAAEPPPQLEIHTLQRTKRMIRWRSWLMGLGIFFMLLPGSTYVRSRTVDGKEVSRIEWVMARDNPPLAGFSLGVGICCWIGWFALRRRLRATAL
jgi:hypothetical protein